MEERKHVSTPSAARMSGLQVHPNVTSHISDPKSFIRPLLHTLEWYDFLKLFWTSEITQKKLHSYISNCYCEHRLLFSCCNSHLFFSDAFPQQKGCYIIINYT